VKLKSPVTVVLENVKLKSTNNLFPSIEKVETKLPLPIVIPVRVGTQANLSLNPAGLAEVE
jgi:hypothetical protein